MSNESSTNEETTPLRRPESQISEDVTTSTILTTASNNNITVGSAVVGVGVGTGVGTGVNVNNSNRTNNANLNNTTGNAFATTVVIKENNKNNINNNQNNLHNNYEVRLINNSNNNSSNNIGNNSNSLFNMDTNKRILYRIVLDVFILCVVGVPILCFHLWGQSYKRGFFCDDESLKHPFKDSTVRSWMLYIIGLVLPVGVMLAVEIIKSQHNLKRSNGNTTARHYVFFGYEIPDWMVECYKKIGIFGFGAAVSQLTTDIAKYSIGRLRPHFFFVCEPVMPDGTTCADPINAGRYVEDYRCMSQKATPRMLKEVSLSFPSGHSSFTFYTMIYLALYLQSRMNWRGSKLLRHFLQFAFIMIAWYTAMSRVSDYKHHWSDVLSGICIGSLVSIVVAKYVSDLFTDDSKSTKSYILPKTSQDLPPSQMINSNGHH